MVEGKGERAMYKTQSGQALSLSRAVFRGLGLAVSAAFLGAAVLAKLVDMEVMKMESTGYGIMAIHLLSVFLGATTPIGRVGKEGAAAAAVIGAGYYLCLLAVNGLFFGGQTEGLGVTAFLVALAAGSAVLTSGGRGGKRRAVRYKIPK
jgi:putative membrane protein (TIGR04086 family)